MASKHKSESAAPSIGHDVPSDHSATEAAPAVEPIAVRAHGAHVFVTGVTGFVGKVVLQELLRREEELGIASITVLVRAKKGQSPEGRFEDVAASRCFSLLSPGWRKLVRVVVGELTQPGCGLHRNEIARARRETTHVIHCAASVEFDLPIADAASANITSSMNMLELFRPARGEAAVRHGSPLRHMVFVSTAYVTPYRATVDGVAPESLVQLPIDVEAVWADILAGRADERALKAQTGHPNTYTLTKCMNESLLAQRRGEIPLSIVRPSIVSASLHHPMPGWIDSAAAFAGFVALIGAGRLQVLRADPRAALDIVPCDVVAEVAIDTCLLGQASPVGSPPVIRHAVAGTDKLCNVKVCTDGIESFFREHPIDQEPNLRWIGTEPLAYKALALVHHETPTRLTRTLLTATGQFRLQRRLGKMSDKISYLNEAFPYFTQNTFHFESAAAYDDEAFEPASYVELVCRGVYRNLVRKDEREMAVAGRSHSDGKTDLTWAADAKEGNWAIRGAAYTMRKALRMMADSVTFDRPSFQRARRGSDDDVLYVIVPTHRSYMDFLVCSYLFFARADLGIPIPHIAAAEEFSRIPVLGWLFQQTQAFYLKRGVGREDPELNNKIRELVDRKQTLEFFIEGTRSRSRQFMKPRRGLLRAIQQTGQRCVLLPVAITYDRVPEEQSFLRELQGEPKPAMQLRKLLLWTGKLLAGAVDIGRVHVVCGDPIEMGPEEDVHTVAIEVMAQLQAHTAATAHHLRCFLARNPIDGIDAAALADALRSRGGVVLTSKLGAEHAVSMEIERTMRYHWMHLFYPEARATCPDNFAIRRHCQVNTYMPAAQVDLVEAPRSPQIRALLEALFRPICDEYVAVARLLAETSLPLAELTATRMVRERPALHLPEVEAALEDLCDRGILEALPGNGLAWGPRAGELDAWARACAWPEAIPDAPLRRRPTDGGRPADLSGGASQSGGAPTGAEPGALPSLHEPSIVPDSANGQLRLAIGDVPADGGATAADHRLQWLPRSPLARGATL